MVNDNPLSRRRLLRKSAQVTGGLTAVATTWSGAATGQNQDGKRPYLYLPRSDFRLDDPFVFVTGFVGGNVGIQCAERVTDRVRPRTIQYASDNAELIVNVPVEAVEAGEPPYVFVAGQECDAFWMRGFVRSTERDGDETN